MFPRKPPVNIVYRKPHITLGKNDEVNHSCNAWILYKVLSLSTLVLNSRDWSEIIWLPEISRFKINLAISFIRKKPVGMHWLGYNDS